MAKITKKETSPVFRDVSRKVEQITVGPSVGTIVYPTLSRSRTLRPVPNSRRELTEAEQFRQGVEISSPFLYARNGLLPKMSSKGPTLVTKEDMTQVSSEYDYELEKLNYGQPKLFNDANLYDDSIEGKPSGKAYLSFPDTLRYPIVLRMPNYRDPDQMDGVIEPFPLRETFSNSSIEAPFYSRGIKSSYQNGNVSIVRGSNIIESFEDVRARNPIYDGTKLRSPKFVDAQDVFPLVGEISGSSKLKRPGFIEDDMSHPVVRFDDGIVDSKNFPKRALTSTGSARDLGISNYWKKPTTSGFVYPGCTDGTDSIVFGARKHSMFSFHAGARSTGFMNELPRETIERFASDRREFPTILRTGDPDLRGTKSQFFDDTQSIVFTEGEVNLVFPWMLPTGSKHIRKYGDLGTRPFKMTPAKAATATITVADGDAASGMSEKETVIITSTDGTARTYVIVDDNASAVATGDVLTASSDTGSSTAGSALVGGIAVSINLTGSTSTQNAFLVQLKAAIEHANGHAGKITVSSVPSQANGNQLITLTQSTAGNDGNVGITTDISQLTLAGFQSGLDRIGESLNQTRMIVGTGNVRSVSPVILPENELQVDTHKKFDDSRLEIKRTKFYLTGTKSSVLPGFTSPVANKIAINIDISPSRTEKLFRYAKSSNALELYSVANDSAFGLNFTGSSGMAYYNFSDGRWETIGMVDPGNESADQASASKTITSTFSAANQNAGAAISSGSILTQFAMSPMISHKFSNINDAYRAGYNKIGTPTSIGLAPNAAIYHATGSQLLSMSDYINHPFLLEKVVIKMPINVRRKHGRRNASGATSEQKADDTNRDIDNHVVFLYRQRDEPHGTRHADRNLDAQAIDASPLLNTVSGSHRYLICSGAMAFINSPICSGSESTGQVSYLTTHTPAFYHDFNMPVSGAAGAGASSAFTDTVTVEMIPAVSSRQFSCISRWPSTDSLTGVGALPFQNVWPGGTSPLSSINEQTASLTYKNLSITNSDSSTSYLYHLLGFNPSSGKSTGEIQDDTRPRRMRLGSASPPLQTPELESNSAPGVSGNRFVTQGYVSNDTPNNIESPYLLFPEDKLILGFEAGISAVHTVTDADNSSKYAYNEGNSFSRSAITGSFVELLQGKASITLYGSLVKDGIEHPFSLNQPLTSNDIHETIATSQTQLDQYQIYETYELIGGRAGENYAGDIINGTRGVTTSINESNFSDTASPKRVEKIFEDGIQIYDTMLPDILKYSLDAGATSAEGGSIVVITTSIAAEEAARRMEFPYFDNPTRLSGQKTKVLVGGVVVTDRASIRKMFFMEGYTNVGAGNITHRTAQKGLGGASAFKYGIANITPVSPSAIFRRDRYGQFRDMLEQRIDTTMTSGNTLQDSPIECKFFTTSGVSADASQTNSSNMHPHATSSIPYMEGESTNRGSAALPGNRQQWVTEQDLIGRENLRGMAGTMRTEKLKGQKRQAYTVYAVESNKNNDGGTNSGGN
tara:strand:+ start:9754 stop:14220 length:4467 start_codon:yes stop_codon:yes gene_type:complete